LESVDLSQNDTKFSSEDLQKSKLKRICIFFYKITEITNRDWNRSKKSSWATKYEKKKIFVIMKRQNLAQTHFEMQI
jgi:hypothetical protein